MLEAKQHVFERKTVPGTDARVILTEQPADQRLAWLMGDPPGTGHWVTTFRVTVEPGLTRYLPYRLVSAVNELEARLTFRRLWIETVTARNLEFLRAAEQRCWQAALQLEDEAR